MRVLVLGGSGFVGRWLTRALLEHGFEPTVFALQPGEIDSRVSYVEGSRGNPEDLRRLARGDYDGVVDLIAYREQDTRGMVELWRGRVGRFVHLSTVSVYAAAHAAEVTEENAVRWDSADEGYGARKAACERVLEEAHRREDFPSVILRSPPIMGPRDPISREAFFLKRLLQGRPVLVPGDPCAHVVLVYVEDLVRAIINALSAAGAAGRAYHLAQRERVTLRQHVEEIARLSGTRPRIEPTTAEVYATAGLNPFAFPYAPLEHSAWIDASLAARELGFRPTPYERALEKTIRWLLEHDPLSLPAWPGRGSVQSRLAGTHEWIFADDERRAASEPAATAPAGNGRPEEPAPPGTEQVLELFAGTRGESHPPVFLTSSAWAAQEARQTGDARPSAGTAQRCVVVPDGMGAWLEGAETWEHTATPGESRGGAGPVLEAVLERDPLDSSNFKTVLYTRQHARRARGYGHGNAPTTVHFIAFTELDQVKEVSEKERVVVGLCHEADARAFVAWLKDCAERGCVVPSLESYSRLFFARSCRWARLRRRPFAAEGASGARRDFSCPCANGDACAPDGPAQLPCRCLPGYLRTAYEQTARCFPALGQWVRLFDICRLAQRAKAFGPAATPVTVEMSLPAHRLVAVAPPPREPAAVPDPHLSPDPATVLIRARGRYFVCHVSEDRMLELTRPLAALLEILDDAPADERAAVESLRAALGIRQSEAAHVYAAGLNLLSQNRVLPAR